MRKHRDSDRDGLHVDEIEDVELLQRSIREETVRRLPLIVEELNGDGQFGREEQLQMRAIEIQQRQPPTGFAQPGEPNIGVPRQVLSISVTL
jgi:hypothetical protein